jgi:hypothetical protein
MVISLVKRLSVCGNLFRRFELVKVLAQDPHQPPYRQNQYLPLVIMPVVVRVHNLAICYQSPPTKKLLYLFHSTV